MYTLTVLYGNPKNVEEFEAYYGTRHKDTAGKFPNVRRKVLGKVVATPKGDQPYHRSAVLFFDTREEADEAIWSPQGQAVLNDIDNFATGGSVVFLSEVVIIEIPAGL
jgi:uncharacterized protein (TIGR02118 family)